MMIVGKPVSLDRYDTQMQDKNSPVNAVYLRKTFAVENADAISALTLNLYFDDA
jgi:hypothetical protein